MNKESVTNVNIDMNNIFAQFEKQARTNRRLTAALILSVGCVVALYSEKKGLKDKLANLMKKLDGNDVKGE